MKLFEIPIYAISPQELEKKVVEKKKRIMEDNSKYNFDEKNINTVIERTTFPQRIWLYNHIIGYITIVKKDHDIVFKIFVPSKEIKHYRWESKKKKFVIDRLSTGLHFRIDTDATASYIQDHILFFLNEVSQPFLEKGYYIDRETFDSIDRLIDYSRLQERE